MPLLPDLEDDGLPLPAVGEWGERKYRLIAGYAQMFSTAMRGKWKTRAYVDLFAGPGRARLRESGRIIATSATLALGVRHPFDRYVFCELDPGKAEALRRRVARDFPRASAKVIEGNCNERMQQILEEIPRGRRGAAALSFCVADPYGLASLKFATIERLAERYVDFLVLVASYMDAHRNERHFVSARSRTVADFLGSADWRDAWASASRGPGAPRFGDFVVDQFGQRMRSLGYLYPGPQDTVTVRAGGTLLYHLAFFSRHPTGRRFWEEARRYGTEQLDLSF